MPKPWSARWLGLDLVVGAVSLQVRLRSALARRRAGRLASPIAVALPGLPENAKTAKDSG